MISYKFYRTERLNELMSLIANSIKESDSLYRNSMDKVRWRETAERLVGELEDNGFIDTDKFVDQDKRAVEDSKNSDEI